MNRNQTRFSRLRKDKIAAGLGGPSRGFSLLPLFLDSQSISFAARRALRENRVNDAAVILMQDYGLSCVEAGELLNVTVC